jgi:Rrf2 family protein
VKISTRTRYGVRALFDLASHADGQPARDVARRQSVPLRFLEQIFQDLRRAHLVQARRGPHGGYRLARTPDTISIGDVVRAVQGPIELFDEKKNIGVAWRELADQINGCFESMTIADLLSRSSAQPAGKAAPMYFI